MNEIPKYCLFLGFWVDFGEEGEYNKVMIKRDLESEIRGKIGTGKTIVIFGARQVGKTTLIQKIFGEEEGVLWLNGDDDDTRAVMAKASKETLGKMIQGYKTVIIDEAQRIEDIGLKLKILHDNYSNEVQFVATGSSSFDLANKINEPMTGRKWTFWLPAFTARELVNDSNYITEYGNLENRLIYGSYPAVVTAEGGTRREILDELKSDNLYKDVLSFGEIIKTTKLREILQALALQIGSQVSMNELGALLDIDRKTVDKYISLLEQAFIIFRLPSFKRNLRNELKTSQKIYFYDNGIRNALINDYRPVGLRDDAGALFENYIVSEMKKTHVSDNLYFWRNLEQQEIDLLIERDGVITAIEAKYSPKKSVKFPKSFEETYRPGREIVVNRENYLDLLVGEGVEI